MIVTADGENLEPCPFCGAGTFDIKENRSWQGMKWSDPISVEVRHWCPKVDGQPSPRMIAMVGRDRPSAVASWNRRYNGSN